MFEISPDVDHAAFAREQPDRIQALAREHLAPEAAEEWLASLRPAIRLDPADGTQAPVVGQVGGTPSLPPGAEWPEWDVDIGMNFVARIDCAALPPLAVELGMPTDGTLLFFHHDDGDIADPDGFRVLHIGADEKVEPRPTPEDTEEYPAQPLVACRVLIEREGDEDEDEYGDDSDKPEGFGELQEALYELPETEPAGQIGGLPESLQEPVEDEIAKAVADGAVPSELAGAFSKDAPWLLLAHFYYQRHDGRLYYLIQPDDLAARRFHKVMFTWQCT